MKRDPILKLYLDAACVAHSWAVQAELEQNKVVAAVFRRIAQGAIESYEKAVIEHEINKLCVTDHHDADED